MSPKRIQKNYDEKLAAYGAALVELDEADAACRAAEGGWPSRANDKRIKRLERASKALDKLRGPMETALGHYARMQVS